MSPRTRERTSSHHLLHRRLAASLATALLATGVALHSGHSAAASTEQGSIAVHALATLQYPCPSSTATCGTTGIRGVSSGYLVGLSGGQAYDVEWSTPEGGLMNLAMSLDYDDHCGLPVPTGSYLHGAFTVTGAVVYRGGLSQNATVSGDFYGTRDGTASPVGTVSATVTFGTTSISIFTDSAAGILNLLPLGKDLCPGTGSLQFSIDGTVLTAL
jgi:hypothetical protein